MSTALLLWTVHLNLKVNDIVAPETLGDNQGQIGTYNFVVPGLSEPLF